METVAIAGVGLIGGSFALALRAAGFKGRILGVSSPATIRAALDRRVIDAESTLEQAAATADLLYLAQPISIILESIERIGPHLGPNTLVTDVGSTKAAIVSRAKQYLPPQQFIGGHPMAGKESRGVAEADPRLFQGCTYFLTPGELSDSETPAFGVLEDTLKSVGAFTAMVSPEEHDRMVAFTSHLPQLLSTCLAGLVDDKLLTDQGLPTWGPGLASMLRLAGSSWDIWKDIIFTNQANIEHALDVYIDKLTKIRQNFDTQETGTEFSLAAGTASRVRNQGNTNRNEQQRGPKCE
jgi:prephenate dehydrogenase